MMKDLGVKTYLYPQPVLILGTYDEDGNPNAMNAAWGMISDFDKITICLDFAHKTVLNLFKTKAMTISPATKSTLVSSDYVGIVSGNDVKDKIAKAGLTPVKSTRVNAPYFKEYPLVIETELFSTDEETGLVTLKIVNVMADDSIMDGNRIDLDKLEAISYDPSGHGYYLVKGRAGDAFKAGLALKK